MLAKMREGPACTGGDSCAGKYSVDSRGNGDLGFVDSSLLLWEGRL